MQFAFVFIDEIKRPTIRVGEFTRRHQDLLVKLLASLLGRKRNTQIHKLRKIVGVCFAVLRPFFWKILRPVAFARH